MRNKEDIQKAFENKSESEIKQMITLCKIHSFLNKDSTLFYSSFIVFASLALSVAIVHHNFLWSLFVLLLHPIYNNVVNKKIFYKNRYKICRENDIYIETLNEILLKKKSQE